MNAGRPAARCWRARLPLPLLLAVAVGACAVLPPPPPGHHYAGRFSLAVTHGSADAPARREAWAGRFALEVGAQALALDLISPLGSTIARFETDPHEARLLVPDNGTVRVEHGTDAQALAEQVLGWSLPMAGMPDWVEGRPAPGRPFQTLERQGDAQRFVQDGWSVSIAPPVAGGAGRRLQMDRPGTAAAPAVALRVILDGPAS